MALDGLVINSIVQELSALVLTGRIDKIYQPERDEIIFNIRNFGESRKLLLTANSANPRIHFTEEVKGNPTSPPMFCMILRKYINGGKITKITQPNFERIVFIHIESLNELGDMSEKKLIIEIMGKHSNIILVDDKDIILDSIKRVNHEKSSVREVLPGKVYVLPPNQDKTNPLISDSHQFSQLIKTSITTKIHELIMKSYTGISPIIANEICYISKIDPSTFSGELNQSQIDSLYLSFEMIMNKVKNGDFQHNVIYDDKYSLCEFSCIPISCIKFTNIKTFASPSTMVEFFYNERDKQFRLNQKSSDIKRILQTTIERFAKKIDIQTKAIKDTENMNKYKIKGELITANIYKLEKGMEELQCENFYSPELENIKINLNKNFTPAENAQDYFKKYNKKKRTFASASVLLKENQNELDYLESIYHSIHASTEESDINALREELEIAGIVKKRKQKKNKIKEVSKPLIFKSSDGFDIYVGKNNIQNDELTLRFAENDDIWLHTKNIPGSHVIIRTNGKLVPDNTLNEACNLAGFYSKSKNSSSVPVDYTERKNVRKPKGAKPGMVIYSTNKTAYVTPSESEIRKLSFNNTNIGDFE